MPDETSTAPPPEATDTPPADGAADEHDGESSPNDWFRETALGLTARPLEVTDRKQQWDEANAELRRGRRDREEPEAKAEEQPAESDQKAGEATTSRTERDERDFERQVQAEVDRREAVRRQRAESQRERELRQTNPTEYARLKEQQEQASLANQDISNTLRSMATMFDDAAITPLVQSLDEKARESVLKDPGHGIDGRKTIVDRAIKALKQAAHDEGYAKGKAEAQKSLRRSSAFRKELLTELRDGEEEPELAPSNGSPGGHDWDMNDWMRAMTGRTGGSGGNGRSARE
jgi:hypothetical protein